MHKTISVEDTIKWITRMAAKDGVISANERRLLREFAEEYEIDVNYLYRLAYAQVDVLDFDNSSTVMEIVLHQGLNRQIRKMFEHLGFEVVTLKRVQHATITLEGLKRGEFKPIKPGQIKDLRNFLNRIASKNA